MWRNVKTGTLSDFTIIERYEILSGDKISVECRKYPVHKIIMYNTSDYFKNYFETNMETRNEITIDVTRPGLVKIILKEIYKHKSNSLYHLFVKNNCYDIDIIIELYNICEYLLLFDHMELIEVNISCYMSLVNIIKAMRSTNIVPSKIVNIVHQLIESLCKISKSSRGIIIKLSDLIPIIEHSIDQFDNIIYSAIESISSNEKYRYNSHFDYKVNFKVNEHEYNLPFDVYISYIRKWYQSIPKTHVDDMQELIKQHISFNRCETKHINTNIFIKMFEDSVDPVVQIVLKYLKNK